MHSCVRCVCVACVREVNACTCEDDFDVVARWDQIFLSHKYSLSAFPFILHQCYSHPFIMIYCYGSWPQCNAKIVMHRGEKECLIFHSVHIIRDEDMLPANEAVCRLLVCSML